jgi:NAD-dependent deacetylase
MSSISRATDIIHQAKHVLALTGAGCSTESGIPDFRSSSGLWARFDPAEYGTISAFHKNPAKVWMMLAELVDITDARPNAGHMAMATLERRGILKGIITQNIDGLHQKAGSKNVVEFHGTLSSFSCLACATSLNRQEIMDHIPPHCPHCKNLLKPDIVFFGEQIPDHAMKRAHALLAAADVLIVAGTSCQVIPASYFPKIVRARDGVIIEINKEPALKSLADIVLQGGFSKVMTQLLEHL